MTMEEAIAVLRREIEPSVYEDEKSIAEAVDMAIEALRREKPKNPVINFVSDADGSRRLNEGWREDALLCPVCHTYFGEVFEEGYCRKCGQKLIQKRVRVIEP
jgi:hypothetical protein